MKKDSDHQIHNLEDFAGTASDWFWETDATHRFTYFSSRMEEVTGVNSAALIGMRRDMIKGISADAATWAQHFDDLKNLRAFRNFEYTIPRANSTRPLWIRVAGQPVLDKNGKLICYRGTGQDITSEKEAIQRLEALNEALEQRNRELDAMHQAIEKAAFEDMLTNLPNRRAFERDITTATAVKSRTTALLIVDLDRFKWINDTWGHPAGDFVLVQTARRLCDTVGTSGTVYRIGGDEFTIILSHEMTADQAAWLGDSIVEKMTLPICFEGLQLNVGASVGLALSKPGPSNHACLIRYADHALYEAKRSGRNTLRQVTPSQKHKLEAFRRLAADVPDGLKRGEFIAYFQPQVDARSGDVTGAETLVRWQHPKHGLLLPTTFLNGAAELGLVGQIDKLMLERAMVTVKSLADMGIILPSISINVSQARLLDPDFADDVERLWTERRCRLAIELLESLNFDDIPDEQEYKTTLQRLRQMGVRIEIDDFGSGRASITGLMKIRPERLKIARSVVQAAVDDPDTRGVMTAILDMSRALNISCIAEGVETPKDISAICELGCDAIQGFAVSHPLNETDFAAFLTAHNMMITPAAHTKTAGPMDLPRTA
ncbi:EAL domain-containing protein [Yoonia sp.]|uniref:putative bifunctional diguanylate cyclase/phosphodiesterase n=1 Tax=Yoonia sp. TaxID=2212373 RepID=UPI0019FC6A71|nr:EAL domain-containing protein [Yoonia sp.]MBE0414456.1 EAL domain-containing protein [Yoonia sp.]